MLVVAEPDFEEMVQCLFGGSAKVCLHSGSSVMSSF